MEPTLKYPFNVRSFFTDRETKVIGGGVVLWRGYFQSVRPGIGKMLINIDISTGAMYLNGNFIQLCQNFFRIESPKYLSKAHLPERDFLRLQRFVAGMRVTTAVPGPGGKVTQRVVKRLTRLSAQEEMFQLRDGENISVAEYFRRELNRSLQYPDLFCVEVSLLWPHET
jgi:eukaryotic translation initiation factor 2C